MRRAMDLFWRGGYQDTSISDLTAALGISAPSLYAAYGSKAALFTESANRYQSTDGAEPLAALDAAPTAMLGVEALLRTNLALFTRRGGPRGCLLTRATLSCPADEPDVRAYLERSLRDRLGAVERRLQLGVHAGEHLPVESVGAFAMLVDALVQGLAVRALEGASRRRLDAAVDAAMGSWLPATDADGTMGG